jgi:hypothetical protein
MLGLCNFKLGALCAILTAMLVGPAPGLARDEMGAHFKERTQIIKSLQLAPEEEKAVLAVEEKYVPPRQAIIAGMEKANDDLQATLATATPDGAKLKALVSAILAGQEKLLASFKKQRDEELALMDPVAQGKYIMALGRWRHEMMGKVKKKEAGEKKPPAGTRQKKE